MARPPAALRATRFALAAVCAGFGVFLLVRAWQAPLDGSGTAFVPIAFIGAIGCFAAAVALLVRQPSVPRRGRPAAR